MADKKSNKEAEKEWKKPSYYVNRELSWLEFNCRILGEAKDRMSRLRST